MKILYFASLREVLGINSEEIIVSEKMTVNSLRKLLINKYGDNQFPNNILCAVNHEIANDATQLNDNDEVAFYPPVTGG
ncbi:molybdopterin converting factor subunit 1 [Candidatus Thioglobus sp.]|uniref:molybdopterin converting factor subunit 1 n=1 Tax=Candidatus Thioglobus sp. TaxID=2026721 RepID=UPI002629D7C9|nr:molybdopterin converting factor subunit 1 [Candidatus Thioglobus sp.]MDG2395957.1 molybdopterin converting factor subunit 1 [Candidatus Thioglobus sp.]